MARDISCVSVTITTICNMHCPDCCAAIHFKPYKHYGLDYLVELSQHIHDLDRIHLTGGEPSVHPQFPQIAAQAKSIFRCRQLTLETNGFRFRKHAEAFENFDVIYLSHYTRESFPHGYHHSNFDNTEIVEEIKNHKFKNNVKVVVGEIEHISFAPSDKSGVCHRGHSETVSVDGGVMYPCCVGPGLKNQPSISPQPGWRELLAALPPNCDKCPFAL